MTRTCASHKHLKKRNVFKLFERGQPLTNFYTIERVVSRKMMASIPACRSSPLYLALPITCHVEDSGTVQ